MTIQAEKYYSRTFQERDAKARAAGRAESVLRVLRRRGLAVREEQERRITGTIDQEQLDDWLDRAVTAERTEELFEENSK